CPDPGLEASPGFLFPARAACEFRHTSLAPIDKPNRICYTRARSWRKRTTEIKERKRTVTPLPLAAYLRVNVRLVAGTLFVSRQDSDSANLTLRACSSRFC